MGFSFEVNQEGLAAFVTRARTLAEELGAASPSGDDSLSSIESQASALPDPDIAGLLGGIFSDHSADLTNAVVVVEGGINSVEQAGATVMDNDHTTYNSFTTQSTGAYNPYRFSVQ